MGERASPELIFYYVKYPKRKSMLIFYLLARQNKRNSSYTKLGLEYY